MYVHMRKGVLYSHPVFEHCRGIPLHVVEHNSKCTLTQLNDSKIIAENFKTVVQSTGGVTFLKLDTSIRLFNLQINTVYTLHSKCYSCEISKLGKIFCL